MSAVLMPDAPLGHAGPLGAASRTAARLAAGPWRSGPVLGPVPFEDRYRIESTVGIYLVTDRQGRLVYLGQARRDGGVRARLDGHAADAVKALVFAEVWVVALRDFTPAEVVSAVEGRVADDLAVRGRLRTADGRRRRWPGSGCWEELVVSQAARAEALRA